MSCGQLRTEADMKNCVICYSVISLWPCKLLYVLRLMYQYIQAIGNIRQDIEERKCMPCRKQNVQLWKKI